MDSAQWDMVEALEASEADLYEIEGIELVENLLEMSFE